MKIKKYNDSPSMYMQMKICNQCDFKSTIKTVKGEKGCYMFKIINGCTIPRVIKTFKINQRSKNDTH